ncbi:Uncharacterised protein [Escherichia coli]|nr:Uncharacterised protein [Escherichia coli]CAD5853833.1 Uncharacterised protein [Escherichia coli]CAD6115354.1 Uncharacterised protein [Escherichia coli]
MKSQVFIFITPGQFNSGCFTVNCHIFIIDGHILIVEADILSKNAFQIVNRTLVITGKN